MRPSFLGNGFLGILLVPGRKATSVDLFNSILTIEQCGGLLQTEALCLDDEHVAEEQLEDEPTAVNDIVFPPDIAKSDGIDVLIEDEGEGNDEAEEGEALGTEGIWENLESVRHN